MPVLLTYVLIALAVGSDWSIKKSVADVANRTGRTVVFVRTKLGADRVARAPRSTLIERKSPLGNQWVKVTAEAFLDAA